MMAVHTGLGVQIQLLWTGWQQLLSGHYAAAAVPCRQISELNDFIWASALDEAVARKLMTNEEVRVGDARAVIARKIDADPGVIQGWREYRKLFLDGYNATAHARTPLLMSVAHVTPDRHMNVGHGFNESNLQAFARIYAQLSVNAALYIGGSFSDRLPDDGAWSIEQASLLADWEAFQRTDIGGVSIRPGV